MPPVVWRPYAAMCLGMDLISSQIPVYCYKKAVKFPPLLTPFSLNAVLPNTKEMFVNWKIEKNPKTFTLKMWAFSK